MCIAYVKLHSPRTTTVEHALEPDLVASLRHNCICREEGAETLIEQMSRDQDPIIRYGAMFVVGLAYRGTANNGASYAQSEPS